MEILTLNDNFKSMKILFARSLLLKHCQTRIWNIVKCDTLSLRIILTNVRKYMEEYNSIWRFKIIFAFLKDTNPPPPYTHTLVHCHKGTKFMSFFMHIAEQRVKTIVFVYLDNHFVYFEAELHFYLLSLIVKRF